MESNLSVQDIKKRAVVAFFTLMARQIALRAVSFITLNIILARVLPVETLGIFNIATGVITFFAFFSDVGLSPSLIQKKEAVSENDIKTAFSVQGLIVGFLSVTIILFAPLIAQFYNLNSDGVWLVRVLGLGFFLSSLKVIPSVLLERELKFQPLVSVEVVETLVFNSILITTTLNGFGIWSFTYAALGRGIVGVVLIYIIAPIKIRLGIHKQSAKQLLSFGVPFQLNSLLSLFKDRLVPLVVAKIIGPLGMGYVTWAQSLAFLPLELMNIVIRITFPTFSRLQHDKQTLAAAVEKSLFVTTLLVYPAIFGLGAILPSLVEHVVTTKFLPATSSYYLFAFSTLWSVISTTFTNAFNAVGQVKTTLKLMIMWTILEWLLTPVLTIYFGLIGVAMASFLISFSSAVTIIFIKRILTIKVLDAVLLPLGSSILMFTVVFVFANLFVVDWLTLIIAVLLGVISYSLIILVFGRDRIIKDLRSLRSETAVQI